VNLWHEMKRFFRLLTARGLYYTMIGVADKLMRMITREPLWRFGTIAPKIILGGQPARSLLPKLMNRGVTGVVNLRDEYNYADEVGNSKLHYLYLPTIDDTAPSLEHLHQGVEFIRNEIQNGGGVYIHCLEGLGRGPTMLAAYFVSTGMTVEEAWDKIRRVRPFVRPVDSQLERLKEFAATYAHPRPVTDGAPEEEVAIIEETDTITESS
jgi:protein-tyrosine phosphatase